MSSERGKIGRLVRVKREVDELVETIAEKLGYQPYTIRNYALLLGLHSIALNPIIPKTDRTFEDLLERVRRAVKGMVEENGEKKG